MMYSAIKTLKYPKGVLQSNGHLDTKIEHMFSFVIIDTIVYCLFSLPYSLWQCKSIWSRIGEKVNDKAVNEHGHHEQGWGNFYNSYQQDFTQFFHKLLSLIENCF